VIVSKKDSKDDLNNRLRGEGKKGKKEGERRVLSNRYRRRERGKEKRKKGGIGLHKRSHLNTELTSIGERRKGRKKVFVGS